MLVTNNKTKIHRFIELLFFVREKLKMKTFEQILFVFRLSINIQSFLLLFFVNVFELYRNMYQNLIDFYVLFAKFSNLKRQKKKNYELIFKFYEFNFNDVIIEIQIDIKNFDRDCML